MIGYPFIEELFRQVLSKSNAIEGRFFFAPKYGHEINSDELGQVITEAISLVKNKKYPLALCIPPAYTLDVGVEDPWKLHVFRLFFLKTTFYKSDNTIANPNQYTGTSQHALMHDWHDMARCAENFIKALKRVQKRLSLQNTSFRLSNTRRAVISPVSFIGTDRVSGVRLDFEASIYTGCDLEDYDPGDLDQVIIEVMDTHPEHKM